MRFGVCCTLDEAPQALEMGADYVELPAASFGVLEESDFDPGAYRDLAVEATNVFFPGRMALIGYGADEWRGYAKRTIQRAASIGIKMMVVGSGSARKAPGGVAPSRAALEFIGVVSELQEIAEPFGISVAPESLNRAETNVGNSLPWLARALDRVGVGYTADSYHVLYEWDADMRERDPERLEPTRFYLMDQMPFKPAHVHLANLFRQAPDRHDPMMRAFFARLAELGFDGRISLECNRGPLGDFLPAALEELRELVEVPAW